jgi:hypothetical protein
MQMFIIRLQSNQTFDMCMSCFSVKTMARSNIKYFYIANVLETVIVWSELKCWITPVVIIFMMKFILRWNFFHLLNFDLQFFKISLHFCCNKFQIVVFAPLYHKWYPDNTCSNIPIVTFHVIVLQQLSDFKQHILISKYLLCYPSAALRACHSPLMSNIKFLLVLVLLCVETHRGTAPLNSLFGWYQNKYLVYNL